MLRVVPSVWCLITECETMLDISYRRTRGARLTGLSPFARKCGSYIHCTSHFSSIPTHVHHLNAIFLFSWTRAFQRCVEPLTFPCVKRNSIFPHFVMVITCCGPSCGLWLCVGALNRGAPKIFRKLLQRRNHSSGISRAGPTTTIFLPLKIVPTILLNNLCVEQSR